MVLAQIQIRGRPFQPSILIVTDLSICAATCQLLLKEADSTYWDSVYKARVTDTPYDILIIPTASLDVIFACPAFASPNRSGFVWLQNQPPPVLNELDVKGVGRWKDPIVEPFPNVYLSASRRQWASLLRLSMTSR